jgi:hypothetical protein
MKIAQYDGVLINHLEGLYRPGEKDLAREVVEALGLTAVEVVFAEGAPPLISVHPNADDRDATSNVMFLAEMSPAAAELEERLASCIAADEGLSVAMTAYQEKARTKPGGIPHFGLRYRSHEALDAVKERLSSEVTPELAERVTVTEMPPYKAAPGLPNIRQVFVYTDAFFVGPATFGQLIELQVDRDG